MKRIQKSEIEGADITFICGAAISVLYYILHFSWNIPAGIQGGELENAHISKWLCEALVTIFGFVFLVCAACFRFSIIIRGARNSSGFWYVSKEALELVSPLLFVLACYVGYRS